MKKEYPERPVVGVGAIIIKDGKILLEKRKSAPAKGEWSVPGGLVELGESIEQAVIREVKEETGLDVASPRLVDVIDHISLDEKGAVKYHFVIIDYFVTATGGELRAASDADDLKWVPLDEVEQYDLTESFRRFFRQNRQKLENPNLYF
ncbi:MAG: NUDIX hydrolase [Candidatus Bathyarchaeota archaeon]|nr:NUDIX hydrolase [Candidatus Bathyarchaeota archaeon]